MEAPDGPVLIAYDGSPAARRAVAAAANLVGSHRLLVLTVWEEGLMVYGSMAAPSMDGTTMDPMIDPELIREVDRQQHATADRVAGEGAELARSLGADAKPVAVPDEGGVSDTILSVAREQKAAAIVVGSRGLSGLRERLEGSTSKHVLKHAPCPVLVVHEPHEDQD